MSGPRILVIDDEPDFRRLVEGILVGEGFQVAMAEDGAEGLKQARETHPDLVLLDWNLPDISGKDVCKTLRADPKTKDIPVVMLTVRGRETDTVVALELGASDFVSKRALRPRELAARLHSAIRQGRTPAAEEILRQGALTMDVAKRRVTLDGAPVNLRTKEFDLLRAFLKQPGDVLTRAFLTAHVWNSEEFGTSRTLDTTLARLRAKLGPFGERLQSIKGVGYTFDERDG